MRDPATLRETLASIGDPAPTPRAIRLDTSALSPANAALPIAWPWEALF
ncbi:hypothetical protein [Deinococcus hopiensis]|nr:hypothetical protein [Deinococcus hopiensis]